MEAPPPSLSSVHFSSRVLILRGALEPLMSLPTLRLSMNLQVRMERRLWEFRATDIMCSRELKDRRTLAKMSTFEHQ